MTFCGRRAAIKIYNAKRVNFIDKRHRWPLLLLLPYYRPPDDEWSLSLLRGAWSFHCSSAQHGLVKLKFHGTRFVARTLARKSACRATSPSSLPRAYLIGRPAVCCGVVLPVCPFVVSFSKFHEPDTRDLLRTSSRVGLSSRGCHEDATRKRVSWNYNL